MESGWSTTEQSSSSLLLNLLQDDMDLWLIGSQGQVKAAIILNWQLIKNTNKVQGSVELYTLDPKNTEKPRLQQNFAIFPAPSDPVQAAAQQLILTRKDIFNGVGTMQNVFRGQKSKDQFVFSIDLLRQKATDALALMNLVPA